MHENNFFVVFKKSMRKYIFETSNIFFITTRVAGLNPAGLAGSLAQTSDPAGHKGMREFPHARLG
jgi:hypothetical protein